MNQNKTLLDIFRETAKSIRQKTGKSEGIKPVDFSDEVESISGSYDRDLEMFKEMEIDVDTRYVNATNINKYLYRNYQINNDTISNNFHIDIELLNISNKDNYIVYKTRNDSDDSTYYTNIETNYVSSYNYINLYDTTLSGIQNCIDDIKIIPMSQTQTKLYKTEFRDSERNFNSDNYIEVSKLDNNTYLCKYKLLYNDAVDLVNTYGSSLWFRQLDVSNVSFQRDNDCYIHPGEYETIPEYITFQTIAYYNELPIYNIVYGSICNQYQDGWGGGGTQDALDVFYSKMTTYEYNEDTGLYDIPVEKPELPQVIDTALDAHLEFVNVNYSKLYSFNGEYSVKFEVYSDVNCDITISLYYLDSNGSKVYVTENNTYTISKYTTVSKVINLDAIDMSQTYSLEVYQNIEEVECEITYDDSYFTINRAYSVGNHVRMSYSSDNNLRINGEIEIYDIGGTQIASSSIDYSIYEGDNEIEIFSAPQVLQEGTSIKLIFNNVLSKLTITKSTRVDLANSYIYEFDLWKNLISNNIELSCSLENNSNIPGKLNIEAFNESSLIYSESIEVSQGYAGGLTSSLGSLNNVTRVDLVLTELNAYEDITQNVNIDFDSTNINNYVDFNNQDFKIYYSRDTQRLKLQLPILDIQNTPRNININFKDSGQHRTFTINGESPVEEIILHGIYEEMVSQLISFTEVYIPSVVFVDEEPQGYGGEAYVDTFDNTLNMNYSVDFNDTNGYSCNVSYTSPNYSTDLLNFEFICRHNFGASSILENISMECEIDISILQTETTDITNEIPFENRAEQAVQISNIKVATLGNSTCFEYDYDFNGSKPGEYMLAFENLNENIISDVFNESASGHRYGTVDYHPGSYYIGSQMSYRHIKYLDTQINYGSIYSMGSEYYPFENKIKYVDVSFIVDGFNLYDATLKAIDSEGNAEILDKKYSLSSGNEEHLQLNNYNVTGNEIDHLEVYIEQVNPEE